MKMFSLLPALICGLFLSVVTAQAAEAPKKLTCCQEAKAKNKECTNKCCIVAHKKGQSCVRCNPNKEDLEKKGAKKAEKPVQK